MSHADTIRAYYAAWIRDDLDAVFRLCTDDLIAVNVPLGPLHGAAATREFLNKFARGMTNKRYDVCALLEQGDTVMVEGVESYDKKGKRVSLPYMTVFYFKSEKIREWRDYFDLQTIQRQLAQV